MPVQHTVLLVGGTGRTGRRVLEQLLSRGVSVRVVVRSSQKLPAGAAEEPRLCGRGGIWGLFSEHAAGQEFRDGMGGPPGVTRWTPAGEQRQIQQ